MKHILEADSIMLDFKGKSVLQSVYLKNETGHVTGILGRNGSGKSCLMQIIFGALTANQQSIRLDGKAILSSFSHCVTFKHLPQFNFIPKNLTIKRIFKDFGLSFATFVEFFPDFEKYKHLQLKRLSGGEMRIIEIYAILASKSKFCLLDEPFSQVMPLHIDSIIKIINQEKKNKGIIITDHLYEPIMDVCDDIYVLLQGKTYLTKDKTDLIKLGYIYEKEASILLPNRMPI